MHRSIRTGYRMLVAVPGALALIVTGTGAASAAVVDPGSTGITLETSISFTDDASGSWLRITADGTFNSSFTENTTLALQIVGTETWTDSNGNPHTNVIDVTPSSIEFSSWNHLDYSIELHPNAVLHVSYTAEDAGLAPTPFTGTCTGTGVRLGVNNHTTTQTC